MKGLWLGALLLLCNAPSVAKNKLTVHGFAAQGLINAYNSEFIGEPGEWSLQLSEVGINGRYSINSKVQVVAQGVYLNAGNRYPQGARLDYAFVDYSLATNESWRANIHLGRFKNQNWLYSATQDVPHTRPSIILPQSIYFDGFRDFSLSSDGVSLVTNKTYANGELQFNWSLGKNTISDEFTVDLLGGQPIGDIEPRYVQQAGLAWSSRSSSWYASISLLDSRLKYDISDSGVSLQGESSFSRYQAALRYSGRYVELNGEVLKEKIDVDAAPLFRIDQIGLGGYLQSRFFLRRNVSILTRFDVFYPDKDDKSGSQLSARFNGQVPAFAGFMRTYSLGLRWDIGHRYRLHLEHHWVEGAGRLTPITTPLTLPITERRWRTFAVQFMTWF
jgi:hypothetical protein